MRKKLELTCFASLLLVAVFWTAPAVAATIRQPASRPFTVAVDRFGHPQPFTIVAAGFRPGSLAYVEQCDGASLTAPDWSPTLHCDIGTAPAPVVVTRDGTATFPANDRNHGFHPFRGESPQAVFNCLAPGDAAPHNGVASYTNCRVRVSSNNSTATQDQVFLDIRISAAAARVPTTNSGASGGGSSSVGGNTATASASHNASTGAAPPGAGANGQGSSSDPASNGSHTSSGRLAFTGAAIVGLVLVGCAFVLLGTALRRGRIARSRG
jgi:hypothetical protein